MTDSDNTKKSSHSRGKLIALVLAVAVLGGYGEVAVGQGH